MANKDLTYNQFSVPCSFLVPCSRGLSISVGFPQGHQHHQINMAETRFIQASCRLQVASCKLQVASCNEISLNRALLYLMSCITLCFKKMPKKCFILFDISPSEINFYAKNNSKNNKLFENFKLGQKRS